MSSYLTIPVSSPSTIKYKVEWEFIYFSDPYWNGSATAFVNFASGHEVRLTTDRTSAKCYVNNVLVGTYTGVLATNTLLFELSELGGLITFNGSVSPIAYGPAFAVGDVEFGLYAAGSVGSVVNYVDILIGEMAAPAFWTRFVGAYEVP